MHPEIARSIAEQHQAELHRRAELHRLARLQRLATRRRDGQRPAGVGRLATVRLATVRLAVRHLPAVRLPVVRLAVVRPGRARGAARRGPDIALPGVFTAGPEAFGIRTYLTAAEARQLAADWADLLARFADRVDDPSRRPDGAVPFEVVVLGRQVPDLAGAGRGLTGPEQAD
jgi:hypothetical protein